MSATAGQADGVRSLADRLGIEPGMVVMEIGYDDDVDQDLRDTLMDRCGELVDEDTDEVVDAVLLWWREGDGDLVDILVDALSPLADNGVVWLLTPEGGPRRPRRAERDHRSRHRPPACSRPPPSASARTGAARGWSCAAGPRPRSRHPRPCRPTVGGG